MSDQHIARDYTAHRTRPQVMWRYVPIFYQVRIWVAFDWKRCAAAGGAAILPAVLIGLTWAFLGLSGTVGVVVSLVAASAAGITVYVLYGRPLASQLTATQALAVRFHYRFAQPQRITGNQMTQPADVVGGQVIVWEPTDPGWQATFDHASAWFAAHPESIPLPR